MGKIFGLLAILISFQSHAALLIEPVIGYTITSNIKVDDLDFDDKISGTSFGGRLGWQNMGFQLGLDYLNTNGKIKDLDSKFSSQDWAAFVGFKFPAFFRVYAGYIFSSNASDKDNDSDIKDGSGTKFGVGFTGFPFININLEYRKVDYEKINDTKIDTNTDAIMLSLSLPLTI